VPVEIEFPPPPPQTCWPSNFGATDVDGDTCGAYNPGWCSQNNGGMYDNAQFSSQLMCCECGGGCDCDPALPPDECACTNPLEPDNDDDVTPPEPDEEDDVNPPEPDEDDDVNPPEPDEDDEVAPQCWSNDQFPVPIFDRDGDPWNCSYYDNPVNAGNCGNFDDDDFIASEVCCGCGGGCDCDPALGPELCGCNADEDADGDADEDADEDADDDTQPEPDLPLVDFNTHDLNGDGWLDGTEITNWWQAEHCDTFAEPEDVGCTRNATQLMDLYDTDMSGKLGITEFEAIWWDAAFGIIDWPVPEPEPVDPVEEAFEIADMSMDGELEMYELEMYQAQWCMNEYDLECYGDDAETDCCSHDIDAVIEMFDADESGSMCLEEFRSFVEAVADGTIVWPEPEPQPEPDTDDEVVPDPDNDEEEPDTDDEVVPEPDNDEEEPDTDDEVVPEPDNNDNAITSQEDFDNWAWTRDVPENDVLNCGFDIRNEWHNGYYLWAGQNCEIYDLWVRIYVPRNAWENRKIWETSDMDCQEESCDGEECNALFKITPMNPRLGIAFDGTGDEVNFRFETERWAPCVEEMTE